MAGPGDLYLVARELLDACAEAVALAPGGAISRRYVSPGIPSWDCPPQLTVHGGGPAPGGIEPMSPPLQPGTAVYKTGEVHLITLTATVLRCVPIVTESGFPDASEIDASGAETMGDVWAIWNHLRHRYRAGTLFTRPDGERRELFFDPAVSLHTSGGAGGWQVQIRVALNGYEP